MLYYVILYGYKYIDLVYSAGKSTLISLIYQSRIYFQTPELNQNNCCSQLRVYCNIIVLYLVVQMTLYTVEYQIICSSKCLNRWILAVAAYCDCAHSSNVCSVISAACSVSCNGWPPAVTRGTSYSHDYIISLCIVLVRGRDCRSLATGNAN